MKTIEDINLHTWFIDRELDFIPTHFIVSRVKLTHESMCWILEKLTGRFAIKTNSAGFFGEEFPAFEDSKEALFYELTWG